MEIQKDSKISPPLVHGAALSAALHKERPFHDERSTFSSRGKKIPLTKGRFAIVDPEDFPELSRWRWHAIENGNGRYVAARSVRIPGEEKPRRQRHLFMHRHLLGLDWGDRRQVDHINHDTLDNRRANLRIVSNRKNCENLRHHNPCGVGVRHLPRFHPTKPYWARAWINGKEHYLGCFSTLEEARRARALAVRKSEGASGSC